MRLAPAALGLIAAGMAGYFIEPFLRTSLDGILKKPEKIVAVDAGDAGAADADDGAENGETPSPTSTPAGGDPAVPSPAPVPVVQGNPSQLPVWVANLRPEQLPEQVILKEMASFPILGTDKPMTLPAGAPVIPKRVEGDQLVVSPFGGPIEGKVAVIATNLLEVMGNKAPAPIPAPVTPPAPVVSVDPTPIPEPEPLPAPIPVAPTQLGPEAIVSLMQASIKGGSLSEFSFDQVIAWKASDEETRDGETYQTGLALYKKESIFGVSDIQAQALIKDGKIVRWIWPKSGLEMK